jgi:ribosomal protein L11 methyltransferase
MKERVWKVLRVASAGADESAADWLAGWLAEHGTLGIEQADRAGAFEWRAYFEPDAMPPSLTGDLEADAAAAGFPGIKAAAAEDLEQQNWLDGWREYFKPVMAGDALRVVPSWMKGKIPQEPKVTDIFIEPGMAFGTGTHATTRLCMGMMKERLRRRERVLDIGTGSAILAITAVRLGAGPVTAVDIDPDILPNIIENCQLNAVRMDRINFLIVPLHTLDGTRHGLVLCNMLSHEFLPLLGDIRRRCARGARVLLSGYLVEEESAVVEALAAARFRVDSTERMDEWGGLVAIPC